MAIICVDKGDSVSYPCLMKWNTSECVFLMKKDGHGICVRGDGSTEIGDEYIDLRDDRLVTYNDPIILVNVRV